MDEAKDEDGGEGGSKERAKGTLLEMEKGAAQKLQQLQNTQKIRNKMVVK